MDLNDSSAGFLKLLASTQQEQDTERPGFMASIGALFQTRYEAGYRASDLDEAISHFETSVRLAPVSDPGQATYLESLGIATMARFQNAGNLSDLDRACSCLESSRLLRPAGPQARSTLENLGLALRLRFERLGNLDDVDNAIAFLEQALDSLSDTDVGKPTLLNTLGLTLKSRFDRLGNISNLERAIDIERQVVDMTPDGHPTKPGALTNLGNALEARFDQLGILSDLETSIDAKRKAVRLTPDGHPDRPSSLTCLGDALKHRFERLGNLMDLEGAIEAQQKSLDLTPDDHPDKPTRLHNLGIALSLRFNHLVDLPDLEMAIEAHQKSVELTPDGHPDKPGRQAALGGVIGFRFKHYGNLSDVDEAFEATRKAVDLTPDGHVDKHNYVAALVVASLQKRLHLGTSSDLNTALEAARASAESAIGPPRIRLELANSWAVMCRLIGDEQQTLRAYARAVSLIPQTAWIGLEIESRHDALREIGHLVGKAAAAAAQYGQPDLALEWLEQGRSVVWGQILQLRSPVDVLREHDPVRAERLTGIARSLESNLKAKSLSVEANGRQRALSLEWDELLAEIRKLDGFKDFLGPKKVAHLLSAASSGPVVVLNAHRDGCDALVLKAGADKVIHIALQFTSERADRLLDSLGKARFGRSVERHMNRVRQSTEVNQESRIRDMLAELWREVVKPILYALAISVSSMIPPSVSLN